MQKDNFLHFAYFVIVILLYCVSSLTFIDDSHR